MGRHFDEALERAQAQVDLLETTRESFLALERLVEDLNEAGLNVALDYYSSGQINIRWSDAPHFDEGYRIHQRLAMLGWRLVSRYEYPQYWNVDFHYRHTYNEEVFKSKLMLRFAVYMEAESGSDKAAASGCRRVIVGWEEPMAVKPTPVYEFQCGDDPAESATGLRLDADVVLNNLEEISRP